MASNVIRFHCPHCWARIKAPLQLSGRSRTCPGCEQTFTVPRFIPDDAGPMLVVVERADRFALAAPFDQR